MNKKVKLTYSILLPLVTIVICANLFANNELKSDLNPRSRTEGSVDFQIRTSSYGGEYAPEHVLAIWVTDENDDFITTLARRAWEEIEYLVKWNNMTGGNYQNAIITGATINSHTTQNLTWNCTDNFLASIPDGTYRIYTEFSEDETNVGGPWLAVEFEKGDQPVDITLTGPDNFHDIELHYTPESLPEPTLEITAPANNSVIETLPFNVEFEVTNFDPAAGDGLIGYHLNGNLVQMYSSLDPIAVNELADGSNEITLLLYDESGFPLDPEVSDAIAVIYEPNGAEHELVNTSELLGNYPNPFNPETTISFSIKENEKGVLSIFNIKGQRIFKDKFETGNYQYRWNAEGFVSGMYFYKLSSPTTNITKKMLLMK
jgi:Secretion system C-terminal sorting domain